MSGKYRRVWIKARTHLPPGDKAPGKGRPGNPWQYHTGWDRCFPLWVLPVYQTFYRPGERVCLGPLFRLGGFSSHFLSAFYDCQGCSYMLRLPDADPYPAASSGFLDSRLHQQMVHSFFFLLCTTSFSPGTDSVPLDRPPSFCFPWKASSEMQPHCSSEPFLMSAVHHFKTQ